MFCGHCGAEIEDGALFCGCCGTKVVEPSEPVQPVEPVAPVEVEPVQPVQPVSAVDVQPAQPVQSINVAIPQEPVAPPRPVNIPVQAILIFVEIIAIIAAVVGMYNYIGKQFEAEKVAEKYFINIVNGDVEKAFEMSGYEESEFVNKQTFATYLSQQEDFGKTKNYQIEKDFDDMFEEVGITKSVELSYTTDNSVEPKYFRVNLNKDSKKKYGIYDDWHVVSNDLVYNYKIVVLKNASVKFDGVVLDEKYKVANDENEIDERFQVYMIPTIFMGKHQIDVTLEGYVQARRVTNVYDNDSTVYFDIMSMTEDNVKKLETLVGQNIKTIYTAAINNQPFESLPMSFYSKNVENVKNDYQNLCNYFNSSDTNVTGVDIKNMKITSNTSTTDMQITFDYVVRYRNHSGYEKIVNDNFAGYTSLVMEDGEWVQAHLGAGELGYLWSW